jgi:fucose 4-O-acetylase-like acetyltransferase
VPPAVLERLDDQLDELVENTPEDRDRTIDLLRVGSIGVVIVWHWALSITHWEDGGLVMPNPIDHIPLAWLATWVLQIMPVFFLVGGYVDLRGWRSLQRRGGATWQYLTSRAWRLLTPPAAFAVAWGVYELVGSLVNDDHRPAHEWGGIMFVPFWFLAAYTFVVLLVPLTARWHDRARWTTLAVLVGALVVSDAARFAVGIEEAGYVSSALVWITIHQLGYLLGDGTLDGFDRRGQLAFVGAAIAALALLTGPGPYPGSMVTTQAQEISNMWPTTAVMVLVATLQLGLIVLVRPALASWLRRRRVWKAVVAINTVIMTVFVWHMVAKVTVLRAYEALGFELIDEPTLAWWLQRPLWLLAPALVLAVLVAVFFPFELWSRRR